MSWSAARIRKTFVDFFVERQHRHVRSSPLIPGNDPTLFFTNSGMVQFKDVFVGAKAADYTRATTVQKCLRVSGKHNDLENVGRTARHHTFFEMLGNFSFGDYFKRDAILFGWELLTRVFELPVDKLHVSVHPEDEEAFGYWRDLVGVPVERIHRDPQNFWAMGDTGPCGPCSEIHIDLGPAMSGGKVDVAYGSPEGEHRYLELWNLVFMQYERSPDGALTPLPRPSIDTGAGLERLTAVLQGKLNNYDTDLFVPIIEHVAKKAGVTYHADPETDVALRVIADHTRATASLVADGIYPDNEGRGYVLRRVMRRAIRFGRILGIEEPFLVETTALLIDMLGDVYPELVAARETIHRIVLQEEKRFGRTIKTGLKLLGDEMGKAATAGKQELAGDVAFVLYDTHGFPLDLTALILSEKGMSLDQAGFDAAMEAQRARARAASKFGTGDLGAYQALVEDGVPGTRFTGYSQEAGQATVLALMVDGVRVPRAAAGQRVEVVVDETPFYAESGGQVGDVGALSAEGGLRAGVQDTQRPFGELVVHQVLVEDGTIEEGQRVALAVDHAARADTRKNHSATHLMHDALRKVLGGHVRQRGSLVGPHRLRFDFSHTGPMTDEEIRKVELLVNAHVVDNEPVETDVLPYDQAMAKGAIAFFEEKYGDVVRVLSVGSESVELCGGTHVSRTGDIGLFKIVSEGPISAGVRRLEAVTGMDAVRFALQRDGQVRSAADMLRVAPDQVVNRLGKLLDEKRELESDLAAARLEWRKAEARATVKAAPSVGAFKVAAVRLDGLPGKDVRPLAEALRGELGEGVVMVVGTDEGKVSFAVTRTAGVPPTFAAGTVVAQIAPIVSGKGGGKPDFAQAGGTDVAKVDELVEAFRRQAAATLG
ncbi:MAG: alanine--tRNA ligase [Deltaproteobacteria bacterium]|nr:alanine--tRNA ligase [Deltaproteobacteria bacterium]